MIASGFPDEIIKNDASNEIKAERRAIGRATGSHRSDKAPIGNRPDYLPKGLLDEDFVGAGANEILALLGPVEAGEKGLGVASGELDDELAASLHRLGKRRYQRVPACAQHLQAVIRLGILRWLFERRVHVSTL
mgnify:CR=1 FL=1